jgi:NAD(P)H-dependent FMN reductase
VTEIDLHDFPLPLYDGDSEIAQGLPDNGRRLKDVFLAHDGLIMACPEYNSGISGVLKNAIDWVSRPVAGRPPLECFSGKVAAIMSASPGALGGLRGLVQVRSILSNINVIVLPEQVAIPKADAAFGPDGSLNDTGTRDKVRKEVTRLVDVVRRLRA